MPHRRPDASRAITLPVRHLVEFLLREGSIDNRLGGFDRANEGARLHRMLQRSAAKRHPGYQAEVPLQEQIEREGILYTLEGRADGLYTDADGVPTVEEFKTTLLSAQILTERQPPEHWAQGQVYAALYAHAHALETVRVRLIYYQVDEAVALPFERTFSAQALWGFVLQLLDRYAPWARRAVQEEALREQTLRELIFPFESYRPGQRAMASAVYTACQEGGQLLCQAPTGIGKTMSVLFPALKALGSGVAGPVFYLTARGTTRAAAQSALALLRAHAPALQLRSVTLTARDKACLCEQRDCTPDACPYANGYYERIRDALWDALDTPALTPEALQALARRHRVCPFELALDASLWSDVIIGDYNYLFDPVARLRRFFDGKGDYLFLIDEAHNLPGRAREMHSAVLEKSLFLTAKKLLGPGRNRLKSALQKLNALFVAWRHRCEQAPAQPGRHSATVFQAERDEELDRALAALCEPLKAWLEEHREADERREALLTAYFSAHEWLRVAESYDSHFVFQASAVGSEVRLRQLCLDPSSFLAQDIARGRAAVLYSATLAPASYYKDLCGVADARAVALRSPFPPQHLGLYCACDVSTRYKDRQACVDTVADYLAAMAGAQTGNYLAFFPSYAYLQLVWERFVQRYPDIPTLQQESGLDEAGRERFLQSFAPRPDRTLLGFAVLGGVFGEGVDLVGDRLIGVVIVGPGLPQVNPQQEQLRDYFERTRGCGFEYAYRFPGMNKVLQAAGRVIRTPQDKGVVLLLDDRFASPAYRALMPPHWSHLQKVTSSTALQKELTHFWSEEPPWTQH